MKEILSAYKVPIMIGSIILLVLVIWIGGKYTYSHIYNKGYTAGQKYEQEQNNKAIALAKSKADAERQQLNSELDKVNSQYRDVLAQKEKESTQKKLNLEKYKKSQAALGKCLDDYLINLYNESL